MNLFNKNAEAYKLDLKDVISEKEKLTTNYYMGYAKDGGVRFLIKTYDSVQELIFNRDQAKSLVEQFQFYIGEDDE
jgi:hypothetical protein